MSKMYCSVFVLFAFAMLATLTEEASLPDYIAPCSLSDPKFHECTYKTARATMKRFSLGDKEREVPPLDPLFVKEVRVLGNGRGDGLNIVLKDAKVIGCSDLELKKFRLDMDKKKVTVKLDGDLKIDSTYDINGRLLILPVFGNGHGLIDLKGMKIKYGFDFEIEKRKDGKEYIHILQDYVKYDIGKASFDFKNLFNGDKVLGEATLRILNDSWKEVVNEVGSPIAKLLNNAFTKSIQNFLNHVPMDELFLP